VISSSGMCSLEEPVADVVADGEGVKEGALLEDGADGAADLEEVLLAHGRLISLPKDEMRPESGRSRPLVSLRRTLLPTPAGPRRMRISPGRTWKRDVFAGQASARSRWRRPSKMTTGSAMMRTVVWGSGSACASIR